MRYGIYSCSPRANGNSDFCAALIQKHLQDYALFFPSRKILQPCIACGFCENALGQCSFSVMQDDTATQMYKELFQLQRAIFIVPIYFYHVPAAFKAFLDRAQTWFILPQEQKPAKNLRVKVILIGAREQGEKLFEGAQLSIKYAMQSIGAQVENTLCLYGLDKPGDLAKNLQKQRQILDFIC